MLVDYETTVGSDYDIVCETGEATDDHVGVGAKTYSNGCGEIL